LVESGLFFVCVDADVPGLPSTLCDSTQLGKRRRAASAIRTPQFKPRRIMVPRKAGCLHAVTSEKTAWAYGNDLLQRLAKALDDTSDALEVGQASEVPVGGAELSCKRSPGFKGTREKPNRASCCAGARPKKLAP